MIFFSMYILFSFLKKNLLFSRRYPEGALLDERRHHGRPHALDAVSTTLNRNHLDEWHRQRAHPQRWHYHPERAPPPQWDQRAQRHRQRGRQRRTAQWGWDERRDGDPRTGWTARRSGISADHADALEEEADCLDETACEFWGLGLILGGVIEL